MDIISIEDIQSLIDNSIDECTELEYKRAFPKAKDNPKYNWKEELAKDISAMANANGGTIIYGLSEKAGANGLIMTLWKVDDEATMYLMDSLYKEMLSGKSAHDSLLSAQNIVKNTTGFEAPEYWAGFILLDGLN